MRKISFFEGEFYHVYNRGVDKRHIFLDKNDFDRFLSSLEEFNVSDPIGSIYENSFNKEKGLVKIKKLVNIVSYCLNQNHFHLVLEQVTEGGIAKFMHRVGTGFTMYFNNKYRRTGSLFQGRFKAAHLGDNERLLELSVYVNLNDRVHRLGGSASKSRSSWAELVEGLGKVADSIVVPGIILGQFKNQSEYKKFALDLLPVLIERKKEDKDLEVSLLEEI